MARSQRGPTLLSPPLVAARARGLRQRGFTLLELLCAIAIAALLVVLSGASFGSWIPRYQQRNAAAALAEALQVARSEALRRNVRVDLCPSLDQSTCDPAGRWDAGWITFVDDNGNGKRDAGEPLVRVDTPAAPTISVTGNKPVATYVSYTPYGHTRMASGALQMGTFTVCKPGQTAIEVVLANGGRARIQDIATACP